MLGKLLNSLLADSQSPKAPPEEQIQLACAVLLVDVARADWEDDARERASMLSTLCAQFGLGQTQAEALLEQAEGLHADQVSLHSWLRTLNEEASQEQKTELLHALWRVAFADGELAAYEEATIRKLADLLYLPHADFIRGRHAAESGPSQD